MQLTLHTDYAIRTLLYLGMRREQIVPVTEISERYGISAHHLAKVAKELVKEGLVEGRRGRDGGIRLAVDPEDICIGTLVRGTEQHVLLECFEPRTSTCPLTGSCRLERAMHEARDAFFAVLDRYSLADMLANERELVRLLAPRRTPASAARK